MNLNFYVQLIFLCVVNIIFTFSGVILNTLVIVSFWKSSQLRRKLCHFMILVLSCFDLVAGVTNHPGILLCLISWLREDYDLLLKMRIYLYFANAFLGFSSIALLVMSIERYLGAYCPIFHRTSVTRRRLLILFPILLIPSAVMYMIYSYGIIVSSPMLLLIFMALYLLPFMFFNYKLLTLARKVHRGQAVSPERRTTTDLKNISAALWVVLCLMLFSIPNSFYVAFSLAKKSANTIQLSYIWAFTCYTMNCTLNSLIFFWKNKVLRTEGIKILKRLKDRLGGSQELY